MNKERVLQTISYGRPAREAFHGCDFASRHLAGRNQASTDGFPIEQHGASATVPGITTDFRSRQAQVFPQHARETAASGYLHIHTAPIDGKIDELRLHRRCWSLRRHVRFSPRKLSALAGPA